MKIHAFIPQDELMIVAKVLELGPIEDSENFKVNVFLKDNKDWDNLVQVTLNLDEFYTLLDYENISIG